MQPDQPLATLTLTLEGEAATERLAAAIAPHVADGWLLTLSGELGAGKTRFVRALLSALGHTGRVRSPTFTLMEPYNLEKFELYHFDFYRFSDESEWLDAGFGEAVGTPGAVAVIEWPERAGHRLPLPDLQLRLDFDDPDAPGERRIARLSAFTERGRACLSRLDAGAGSSAR